MYRETPLLSVYQGIFSSFLQYMGVKYNNYHFSTFTVLVSTRGFNTSTEPIDIHNGKHMSLCPVDFFAPSLESLEWERC